MKEKIHARRFLADADALWMRARLGREADKLFTRAVAKQPITKAQPMNVRIFGGKVTNDEFAAMGNAGKQPPQGELKDPVAGVIE